MKQIIIVREDLLMPAGKLAAQVAHASVSCVLRSATEDINLWMRTGQAKCVLGVGSLKGLQKYARLAQEAGLNVSTITDEGRTVFVEPTVTCCAIGPAPSEQIDAITGKLSLYHSRLEKQNADPSTN